MSFDYRKLTHVAIRTVGGLYGLPLDIAVSLALMSLQRRVASAFTHRADLP